jgi:hypothetical protein
MFGVQPHERLHGWSELAAYENDGEVVLPVSLRVALLIIGGQLFGFQNSEVQRHIVSGSGLNVREFFISQFCPLCFSALGPDDENETDIDVDQNDADDFEDESATSVKVLKISTSDSAIPLTIYKDHDMKLENQIDAFSENYYSRDLGTYFWYEQNKKRKKLKLNVYCSILAGFAIHGDVVVIGDITRAMRRSTNWEDLPKDWFDHRLLEVISIVNMDEQVLELVTGLFQ